MSDGQDRSEKATPRRMQEARREGRLSRSQDLPAWVGVGVAVVSLPGVVQRGRDAAQNQLLAVRDVAVAPDVRAVVPALGAGLGSVLGTLAPLFAAVVAAVLVTFVVQGGIHPRKVKLEVKQFNLATGIKRMVGAQAWWAAAKTLLKTALVAAVLVTSVQALVPLLVSSGRLTISAVLGAAGSGATTLLRGGAVAGIALGVVDMVVVLRRNRKQTRMTKREVKEDTKRTEGDPVIKGAIRSRQLATSRNRMMVAVAEADVVVVNPTHVAVALRYEPGRGAPRVVAKGAGAVAGRIRAVAGEHHVPMVEDVPLARALHAACALDQEIPEYLFTAVARVLAFVMALRRRGAGSGRHHLPGGTVAPEDMTDDPVAAVRRRRRQRSAA